MDQDTDLVMESTTDSPEDIAAGLGIDPPAAEVEDPVVEEAAVADPEAGAEADVEEPPVADPALVVAPPKVARPQRKTVDGVAAAARRTATARAKVLEEENAALRQRLTELAVGRAAEGTPPGRGAATSPLRVVPPDATVSAEQIPDNHPAVQTALAAVTAIGERPKQADFDDYEKFEEAKDTWIERRAAARAKVDFVREDVARRETATRVEAYRAGQAIVDRFEGTETDARARHEDYDDVMAAVRTDRAMIVGPALTRALLESPAGGELKYYLATHPAEVHRLNSLSPSRQLAELGKIESRIDAALSGQPKTGEARPGARVTRAPEPVRAVLGDRPSVARARDLNDPSLTQAEYNQLRDEMDVASGKRLRVVALSR